MLKIRHIAAERKHFGRIFYLGNQSHVGEIDLFEHFTIIEDRKDHYGDIFANNMPKLLEKHQKDSIRKNASLTSVSMNSASRT